MNITEFISPEVWQLSIFWLYVFISMMVGYFWLSYAAYFVVKWELLGDKPHPVAVAWLPFFATVGFLMWEGIIKSTNPAWTGTQILTAIVLVHIPLACLATVTAIIAHRAAMAKAGEQ